MADLGAVAYQKAVKAEKDATAAGAAAAAAGALATTAETAVTAAQQTAAEASTAASAASSTASEASADVSALTQKIGEPDGIAPTDENGDLAVPVPEAQLPDPVIAAVAQAAAALQPGTRAVGARGVPGVILPVQAPVAPALPLKTDGNLIKGQNGVRWIAKGVTVYAMPYYGDSATTPDATLQTTATNNFAALARLMPYWASLGINVIRIPLTGYAYENEIYATKAQTLTQLETIAATAAEYGISVLFGWWDVPTGTDYATPLTQPAASMWADVVPALAAYSNVIYEPFNEPHDSDPADWLTGSEAIITRFRQLGYTGLLVMDTLNYSWWVNTMITQVEALMTFAAANGGNVAIGNHWYANSDTTFNEAAFQGEIGQYVGTIPIIGTEYGAFNGAGLGPHLNWNREFLANIRTNLVPAGMNGAMCFLWDWVDPNSMDSAGGVGYVTNALSPYGQVCVQEWLAPDADGQPRVNVGPLGVTAYEPTFTNYQTSGTGLTEVDPENLTVSFIAPASGRVKVTLEAVGNTSIAGDNMSWGIRDVTDGGSNDLQDAGVTWSTNGSATVSLHRSFLQGNLIPGQAYTFSWTFANYNGGVGNMACGHGSDGNPKNGVGPAVMTVEAA